MPDTLLHCACGKVGVALTGEPIATAECYCRSCQAGSARIEALPGAPDIMTDLGGTPYVLYRKDRAIVTAGEDLIAGFRLKPDAPTVRAVATCCNSALFLDNKHAHWRSYYATLWPADARPPIEVRSMTKAIGDKAARLPGDVPNAKTVAPSFLFRILRAWIAMGFRTPKLPPVRELQA